MQWLELKARWTVLICKKKIVITPYESIHEKTVVFTTEIKIDLYNVYIRNTHIRTLCTSLKKTLNDKL